MEFHRDADRPPLPLEEDGLSELRQVAELQPDLHGRFQMIHPERLYPAQTKITVLPLESSIVVLSRPA